MKVLYSTQSTVEFDGKHYYSNPIQAAYKKYLVLGDEITVLCHEKMVRDSHSDCIDDAAVRFCFIKKINSLKGLLSGYILHNKKIINELVKETNFCVIHTQNPHAIQVVRSCKKYRKPYLTVVGACPWDALWNYDWRGKIIAPLAWLQLRIIQNDTPYSIYVTKEFLQKRYPTKGLSIACSDVNICTGIDGVLEKRLKRIISQNSKRLKIGTAAAVDVPYKGQVYMIRALSMLKQQGITMEYHLIGKGDKSRLLHIAQQEGVEKQVIFHGAIPHSEVLNFFDEIDVYCQPSKQEGLPRALIEAMSRGCLCLGSRVAGIPELIDDGYLFKKGNVKAIVRILKGINPKSMENQALINFNKAKEYDAAILNEKRCCFLAKIRTLI